MSYHISVLECQICNLTCKNQKDDFKLGYSLLAVCWGCDDLDPESWTAWINSALCGCGINSTSSASAATRRGCCGIVPSVRAKISNQLNPDWNWGSHIFCHLLTEGWREKDSCMALHRSTDRGTLAIESHGVRLLAHSEWFSSVLNYPFIKDGNRRQESALFRNELYFISFSLKMWPVYLASPEVLLLIREFI